MACFKFGCNAFPKLTLGDRPRPHRHFLGMQAKSRDDSFSAQQEFRSLYYVLFPYQIPLPGACLESRTDRKEFVARLQCRLFDADASAAAAKHYWDLSQTILRVYDGGKINLEELPPIRSPRQSLRGRA